VLDCKLSKSSPTKVIDQRTEQYGTIYQINSPRYFAYADYSNNTYCIWNIAKKGFVTYRVVDQQLQSPSDCDKPGCRCPDSTIITMGANEVKLCGSRMPAIVNQMSSDGLQVKFCSDNQQSAKGILVMAYRHTENFQPESILNPITTTVDVQEKENRKRRQQEVAGKCVYTHTAM